MSSQETGPTSGKSSEGFSGPFLLRARGAPGEVWDGRENLCIWPEPIGDMSSKKARFTFSNISTLEHLKVTGGCARREIKAVPSYSYLPVTCEFGWNLQSQLLQLLLPILLILPVTCVPAAASQNQKWQGAQPEQGSSRGSVNFSGICKNKKPTTAKMVSLGKGTGMSHASPAPTGGPEGNAS